MANYEPLLPQNEKPDIFNDDQQNVARSTLSRWTSHERKTSRTVVLFAFLGLLQIFLLLASAMMLYVASSKLRQSRQDCVSHVSAWSPGLEAVEYETLTFQGSLFHNSAWKGQPRPELDALWHRVGQVSIMSITADQVRRLGKDPEYVVKWPEELGGGHVASVEVFHHLHCLNFLRKATYREYYNDTDISFSEGEVKIRRHLDHCIDLLRQAIMCTGDMGLMTYNWVLDAPAMFPDFDTRHRCRNFDKLLEWGESITIKTPPSHGWNASDRLGVKFLDGDDGIF